MVDVAEKLLERSPYQSVEGLIRARSAKGRVQASVSVCPYARAGRHHWRGVAGEEIRGLHIVEVAVHGTAGRVREARVAVEAPIVAVTVVIVALGAIAAAAQTLARGAGALGRAVDAFNALDTTAVTGGHVAGAARLATVAAQAGLLDAAARQGDRPGGGGSSRICRVVIVGAGKAESLAVGAEGPDAVASHLARPAGGARG